MKFNFDFHLITAETEIGGETYTYESRGGRFIVPILLIGFLLKYFGLISWSSWIIIGSAFCFCLLWDLLTFGAYRYVNKCIALTVMDKELFDNQLYCLITPVDFNSMDDMRCVYINDDNKPHLLVCKTTKDTDIIVGALNGSIPTIFHSAYAPVSIQEIINTIKTEEYAGMALLNEEKYETYSLNDLERSVSRRKFYEKRDKR